MDQEQEHDEGIEVWGRQEDFHQLAEMGTHENSIPPTGIRLHETHETMADTTGNMRKILLNDLGKNENSISDDMDDKDNDRHKQKKTTMSPHENFKESMKISKHRKQQKKRQETMGVTEMHKRYLSKQGAQENT